MALLVEGFCRGTRLIPSKEQGKAPKVLVGIGFPKRGGFEGEEAIFELTMTKAQYDEGMSGKFNNVKDKMVRVPFSINVNLYQGKAYVSHFIEGEPVALTAAAPAVEAA